jgi:hypothetical protein
LKRTGAAPAELALDSGLVQIHRANARAELSSVFGAINERIAELEKLEYAVDTFRQQLLAEQPQIDQFHALCLAPTNPHSGRLSDSMAMLTLEQAQGPCPFCR